VPVEEPLGAALQAKAASDAGRGAEAAQRDLGDHFISVDAAHLALVSLPLG
jgi:hypothetical protein